MTYQFAGFLAPGSVVRPTQVPAGAVLREIQTPFVGVGVMLPNLIGKVMHEAQVFEIASSLGFDSTKNWLFLQYDCWGGQIDFAYGLGSSGGERFGPIEESALDNVQDVYVGLMAKVGIGENEALDFQPFERGFWGET
ncbi:hypothetical protein [Paucibacter sp. DJ2R-2]|uniref:hypothetical protein n=1 Tax=Paucibacter sp. DJ2R-2 TaxID=2893558 RepID=UPI0021E44C4C|nr:hypothetical protein [Paucibacter sp. DJ2R-2]MCV2423665.1 hypothetical protein [Paucibacter sp. DJ4R-1]MCV2441513.1 hypothetical protein [Paucibacter sp. DJ2R-2]